MICNPCLNNLWCLNDTWLMPMFGRNQFPTNVFITYHNKSNHKARNPIDVLALYAHALLLFAID